MDFTLPDTAVAVRDGVAKVAARYGHDYWSRCDAEGRFPREVWQDLADGGWIGLCVPEEYGGGGQGMLELAVACETLAASGGTAGTFLYILTPGFGAMTLSRHGTAEQKREILPGIATGDVQFCLALTEPDAGSNAIEITTSARRDGDDFLISGRKIWISAVENATWMIAVTRTIPAAEAKPRTAGFTLLLVDVAEAVAAGTLTYQPIPKLGGNIVTANQVFFDDVRVPADALIGEEGRGYAKALTVLSRGRLHIAALCVGMAQRVLDESVSYAATAKQGGAPIGRFQLVQGMLADMHAELLAGRSMVRDVAARYDSGEDTSVGPSAAKLFCTEMVGRAVDSAVQVHGGMGYLRSTPVERFYRDARLFRLYEGTSEVQRVIIGGALLREAGMPRG
jgi:acyl-CoA dehydrogenase